MAVNATVSGHSVTIDISGRFDFSSHQEFRKIFENLPSEVTRYIVDMSSATYLDSSALGLLLLLRDHAGGDYSNIQIINCNDSVLKIFRIANFGQLFNIK